MMTGFLEFGLAALGAYVFVNILPVWVFTAVNPPGIGEEVRADRRLEEGIPMAGARLVTPEIKTGTLVG